MNPSNGVVVDPFMFKDAPGTVEVSVIAYRSGDPRFQVSDEGGQTRNEGVSLAEMRARLGGDEGGIADPFKGLIHQISLQPWANADPNETFIRLAFWFQPS